MIECPDCGKVHLCDYCRQPMQHDDLGMVCSRPDCERKFTERGVEILLRRRADKEKADGDNDAQ